MELFHDTDTIIILGYQLLYRVSRPGDRLTIEFSRPGVRLTVEFSRPSDEVPGSSQHQS